MVSPRVLCIAPSWLGDAILARAAVARLGTSGLEVEIWTRGAIHRVLDDLPGVCAVHPSPPGGRLARLAAVARLRRRGIDAALVLAPSFSSALAARLAGARIVAGIATDLRRPLLGPALPDPGRDEHLAMQHFRLAGALLGALGIPSGDAPADPPPPPPLAARREEIDAALRLRTELGISHQPYLVVAPGARYGPAKRYPHDRFAAAAAAIALPRGWAILVVGEAADAAATGAVRAALPRAIDLAGRTSLATLVGLLDGAGGVLANDSGTMHLAAVLGRPVVGVFGSSNPRWTRPLGPRAVAVANPVPCAPCYRRVCPIDFPCMLGLPPQQVVDAWMGASRLVMATPADAEVPP